jgi:hypothetical protein
MLRRGRQHHSRSCGVTGDPCVSRPLTESHTRFEAEDRKVRRGQCLASPTVRFRFVRHSNQLADDCRSQNSGSLSASRGRRGASNRPPTNPAAVTRKNMAMCTTGTTGPVRDQGDDRMLSVNSGDQVSIFLGNLRIVVEQRHDR